MNRWSGKSLAVRETLDGDLQVLVDAVLEIKDLTLLEGHRSNERQAELLAQGKTKVGPGGSKHNANPSQAVDCIPYPFSQGDWQDRDKFHLFAGMVLGVAEMLKKEGKMVRSVRWGGDWNKNWETSDNAFDDFPHFELTGG